MHFSQVVLQWVAWSMVFTEACLHPPAPLLTRRNDVRGDNKVEPLLPISQEDRFHNGKTAPRGLGSQRSSNAFKAILSSQEVDSALRALQRSFPAIEFVTLPHKTTQGRPMTAVKIPPLLQKAKNKSRGKAEDKDRYSTFFTASMHARERGTIDTLLYFMSDLLWAYKEKRGLQYGAKSYSYHNVAAALSQGIIFLPLANPDGVVYDEVESACWRKTRGAENENQDSDTPSQSGVDINRNFDFLWNYTEYFLPSVQAASNVPTDESFYGSGPASEPETKNIVSVVDDHPSLRWYLDIHSYGGLVLYSWGDDTVQTTRPQENFANAKYNGKRGVLKDDLYSAYMNANDWSVFRRVAGAMAKTINEAGRDILPQGYQPVPIHELYPTSGSSADYFLSRSYLQSGLPTSSYTDKAKKYKDKHPIRGFAVELGFGNAQEPDCPFYPTSDLFQSNLRDGAVACMEFLLQTSNIDRITL